MNFQQNKQFALVEKHLREQAPAQSHFGRRAFLKVADALRIMQIVPADHETAVMEGRTKPLSVVERELEDESDDRR
jgi:hypothetical protein